MVVYIETHLIKKEDIPHINFPDSDVINDELKIELRHKKIHEVLKISNNLKDKVQIFFEDDVSIKRVKSRILGVTNKHLILKKNTLIPIARIHNVNM